MKERPEALRCQAIHYRKYAALLKNSIAYVEAPDWRIFLMKDLVAVEEVRRDI